jgi:hypothetical protein
MADDALRFCPRCGGVDLDRESYGSPGTAICRTCDTMFQVLRTSVNYAPPAPRVAKKKQPARRPPRR